MSENLGSCTYDTTQYPFPNGTINGTNAATRSDGLDGTETLWANFSNTGWTSTQGYYYPTQGDCDYALSNAYTPAKDNAIAAANQWGSGKVNVQSSVTVAGTSCNPAVGHSGGSVTGTVTDSYSAYGFLASDAEGVASARLKALLPAGYWYWSSGPSTCSPSGGNWNGSNGYTNIQCSDSGTASYDWRSGSQAQTNLKIAIEGKPDATALQICNSFTGVQSGTCTITYQGGNTRVVPNSPGSIQIVAN